MMSGIPPCQRMYAFVAVVLASASVFLAGCGSRGVTRVASATVPSPVLQTVTPMLTPELVDTPTPAPVETAVVPATEAPSATVLAEGLTIVPDVVGMPYRDARQVMLADGFSLIYRDVLDLEKPPGSVLAQEPVAGFAWKTGGIVILFRGFAPPAMWTSDKCYPLTIFSRSGRLLFYVSLDQDRPYDIRTDFNYGRTGIYDYQMNELDSFSNDEADSMVFEPETSGEYVLALGPFEVSQSDLDNHPGGIPAGCLYVSLPEE
jgi:hypothetical protein